MGCLSITIFSSITLGLSTFPVLLNKPNSVMDSGWETIAPAEDAQEENKDPLFYS